MPLPRGPLFAVVHRLAVLVIFFVPSFARAAEAEPTANEHSDMSSVGKIGQVHENLRRAKTRESFYEEAADIYANYSKSKARVEQDTGLYWSMDVSYLQQWGSPDGGSPAGQFLVTPNVSWDLFKSRTIGEGSVQLATLRHATRRAALAPRSRASWG
jgi:hypothetical protein